METTQGHFAHSVLMSAKPTDEFCSIEELVAMEEHLANYSPISVASAAKGACGKTHRQKRERDM